VLSSCEELREVFIIRGPLLYLVLHGGQNLQLKMERQEGREK